MAELNPCKGTCKHNFSSNENQSCFSFSNTFRKQVTRATIDARKREEEERRHEEERERLLKEKKIEMEKEIEENVNRLKVILLVSLACA